MNPKLDRIYRILRITKIKEARTQYNFGSHALFSRTRAGWSFLPYLREERNSKIRKILLILSNSLRNGPFQ